MDNEQPQTHQMTLVKTHMTGEEEWYCPVCERRILMTWPPNYKKVVLVTGDETAIHNGGKGGVNLQATQLVAPEKSKQDHDPRLDVWSDWMDKVDFDGLWE
jgi:hypothetical protein